MFFAVSLQLTEGERQAMNIWTFIGEHVFFSSFCAFLLFIVLRKAVDGYNQRKLAESKHRNQQQVFLERRQIAEIEHDAIKLLVADTALGEDFDRRLRSALEESRKRAPVRFEDQGSEVEGSAEALATAEAEAEAPGQKRRKPRRT